MKAINKIKSKLIDRLLASGRYEALQEGLYKETICKAYCSVEVPSRALEQMHEDNIKATTALRNTLLDRVIALREKKVINITDEEFEVFKNELQMPNKGNTFIHHVYNRFASDTGIVPADKRITINISRVMTVPFNSAACDANLTPTQFANYVVRQYLLKHQYIK